MNIKRSMPFAPAEAISWDITTSGFLAVSPLSNGTVTEPIWYREWLPALEGVEEKLRAGARVADVGCGHGHSTIIMAEAFPKSRFWGSDLHRASRTQHKAMHRRAALPNGFRFSVATAKSYPADGYDQICFFDCLHAWAILGAQSMRATPSQMMERSCWTSVLPTSA